MPSDGNVQAVAFPIRSQCRSELKAAGFQVIQDWEEAAQLGEINLVRIEYQSYLPDWRSDRPYRESYSSQPGEAGARALAICDAARETSRLRREPKINYWK